MQESESRSRNDKAETAFTDFLFFFWLLNSAFLRYFVALLAK
jgi:hypothetical protein